MPRLSTLLQPHKVNCETSQDRCHQLAVRRLSRAPLLAYEPVLPDGFRGAEGIRTPYLLHAMQALSLVSYGPEKLLGTPTQRSMWNDLQATPRRL